MTTPAPSPTLSVRLPVIFCSRCPSELVNHICVVVGTDELVCLFCARDMVRAGLGHTVAPVRDGGGYGGMGFAPPLDPVDAVALLIRRGAAIVD